MKECKSKLGHEKAEWAVDRARTELQKLGYSVAIPEHVCKNGPDLICLGYVRDLTVHVYPIRARICVEVKLAMLSKCKGGHSWRVNRVTRKKDDLIAVVFPSGAVTFLDMKSHLRLCNKSGDRYLHKLGVFFS